MVAGGMTPAQVLTATTKSAAELLQLADETGTLRPGMRADLVVIGGDPFDLPNLKTNVRAVYAAGQRIRG
jgi:imidazolonepropionase-like amidohydrolase